ncbi:MAG TPA: hypothetical protein VFS18_01335, partial [Actinomycetota bacterium]|nr:hypothetical protein [Actinomycetota bacterium]
MTSASTPTSSATGASPEPLPDRRLPDWGVPLRRHSLGGAVAGTGLVAAALLLALWLLTGPLPALVAGVVLVAGG